MPVSVPVPVPPARLPKAVRWALLPLGLVLWAAAFVALAVAGAVRGGGRLLAGLIRSRGA